MSISLQQLRSLTPGVEPFSLQPGQICFNLADRLMFVGDGSNFKTSFDGSQVLGELGGGWFAAPLSFSELNNYYVVSPQYYGDLPIDGQVLSWDAATGQTVWVDQGGDSEPTAYLTTNLAVNSAPGLDTNAKISNALGVTPKEGDSVVVTGASGDPYQGFYQFITGSWVFAAQYAIPEASQITLSPIPDLFANNVQVGIAETFSLAQAANGIANDALSDATQALIDAENARLEAVDAQTTANNALLEANSAQADATAAQDTANIALTNSNTALVNSVNAVNDAGAALNVANAALPRAGGTMTGDISFNNGQPVDAGTF
jgi:hypothetical protein